ncbi:hypothetical protein [Microbacterium sp.]|uniref:hypothetical protein n=1 Tax=Microbacterium sp. TaxID=51671 RepID=UPI003C7961CB
MVGHLIRLRRAIQRNTPPWKRRLGLGLGLLAAAITWGAALLPAPHARADALALCLGAWLIGWVIGPILGSGAAVLRPEYFLPMPLRPVSASLGLLSSVFAGTGALVTAVAASAIVAFAVLAGSVAGVIAGVVAAALFLVLTIALSRMLYALLGSAMRTALGLQIAAISYGALVAVLTIGWLLIVPLIGILPAFLANGFADDLLSDALRRSPAGWPVAAVELNSRGDIAGSLTVVGALATAALVAVTGAIVLLAPRPRAATRSSRRHRLGSKSPWRFLPASLMGATLGRELRTWTRDPWRRLELWLSIWFGLFVALIATLAGLPKLAVLAGIGLAVMVTLRGTNLYGYDGTALWQLATLGSDEAIRADVQGRQLGLGAVFGIPAIALTVVMTVITGAYQYALAAVPAIVALTAAGTGVAITASVLWPTPGVDPHRRASAADVGDNPLVYRIATWVIFLLTSPTIALAILVAFDPDWLGAWAQWALIPLAIGNGVAVWWFLGSFAARHLARRLPETLARLRHTTTASSLSDLWSTLTTDRDEDRHPRPSEQSDRARGIP